MAKHFFLAGLIPFLGGSLISAKDPFRCQNKHTNCKMWAKRGECDKNIPYMVENCPAECDFCENAGLIPTPSFTEMDYVCDGVLREKKPTQKDLKKGTFTGCNFFCRDRLPTICQEEAAKGSCDTQPKAMRKWCPGSCGICKYHRMKIASPDAYHRLPCTRDEKEREDPDCAGWAKSGECIANDEFMMTTCRLSCGLCDAEVVIEDTISEEELGELKKKKKEKKRKQKKKARKAGEKEEL